MNHNLSDRWKHIVAMMVFAIVFAMALAMPMSKSHGAKAKEDLKSGQPRSSSVNVFALPRLFELPARVTGYLTRKNDKQARSALNNMIRLFPLVPTLEYDREGVKNRRDVNKLFLEKLSRAFELNYRLVKKIPQKEYLEARKRHAEFSPLIKQAIEAISHNSRVTIRRPNPRKVSEFKAVVDSKNTAWDPRLNILKILFGFDSEKPELDNPIRGKSPAAQQVNKWFQQGTAAGNYGDLYDNRDSGHSTMRHRLLPQFSSVVYGEEAKAASMHYGLNTKNFYNTITIGNSSTAWGRNLWRSQTRTALTTAGAPALLYLQYISNHLYFYPEHRDHDPKHGDVFPVNTPYLITSQGSSGSDQPFLKAVGSILAALKPAVKETLKKAGLVMPAVQMIFRRGQKGIETDQDYLSSKAHPSVFDAKNIDLLKMVKLANELEVKDIPAMVGIKISEESGYNEGVDPLPSRLPNKLFDTPGAISRLVRSTAYEKRMIVQAASKWIGKSQKLKYHWVVLRGDVERIKITPKNSTGSRVEIIVPWHERSVVPGNPELTSDRVDIGVFVGNGKNLSAPAFISLMYPGHQKRIYNEQKQIVSIDYQYKEFENRYTDPLLFPARNWRDKYQYSSSGKLIGWNRQSKGKIAAYTRHGAVIVERDDLGRAIKAQKVSYGAKPTKSGRLRIGVQRLPQFLYYRYTNQKDQIGTLVSN